MARTRHHSTYRELFGKHLEQEIEQGTYVRRMTTLVAMYEGRDDDQRQTEFTDWLRATGAFQCNGCGEVCSPQEGTKEDDPVLCWTCRNR